MNLEPQRPSFTVVGGAFAPRSHEIAERPRDAARSADLHDLWPDIVDLAKQPGLLCRLHAILST